MWCRRRSPVLSHSMARASHAARRAHAAHRSLQNTKLCRLLFNSTKIVISTLIHFKFLITHLRFSALIIKKKECQCRIELCRHNLHTSTSFKHFVKKIKPLFLFFIWKIYYFLMYIDQLYLQSPKADNTKQSTQVLI